MFQFLNCPALLDFISRINIAFVLELWYKNKFEYLKILGLQINRISENLEELKRPLKTLEDHRRSLKTKEDL